MCSAIACPANRRRGRHGGSMMTAQFRRLGICTIPVIIGIAIITGQPTSASPLVGWGPEMIVARVPAQRTDLRVGLQPGPELVSALFAREQGWLREAELELEVRHLGWGEIVDSLAAGGLDLGLVSPMAHLVARGQGHDLRVIAAGEIEISARPTRALVTSAGGPVQSALDLTDRWVAVAGIGGPDHLLLQEWLERQGVNPRTVRFAEIAAPQLWPAVAEGRVAGALLAEPHLSAAIEEGARALASPYADQPGDTPLSYFVAESTWLREHADVARRFAQAVHRANAYLEANPQVHREAMARHLGLDPALANRVALPRLETRLAPAQLQRWADLLARATPPEQAAALARAVAPADLLFDTVR
jgi:NitT/TauT family transport system substrate-binding protein